MNRVQWKSAHRSQRLGRRREAPSETLELVQGGALRLPGVRRRAIWALAGVAMIAATLAFWRVQPGEQRGETLAVSVPAASSPAADAGPATVQS